MQKRYLGKSGLEVSSVGLGCMGMSHAYGQPADKEGMKRLIAQAVDLGISFFDTAEVYGPYENEELLGESLAPYRNQVVIATKFGVAFSEGQSGRLMMDSRPATIRKSVEGSLKRLKTEQIDLYYQHRVDPEIPVEEVAGVMSDLIQEGKIKHWGMSEASADEIVRAHGVCPLAAVQSRYSMMYREYEFSLFPTLEQSGIGFVAFSPLANGFLSDRYDQNSRFEPGTDYRSFMPQFKAENMDANQVLLELLRKTAAEKGATPAQISLAWMLAKKPWIVPIPGTRKPDRLIENSGTAEIVLTETELQTIDNALSEMKLSAVYGGQNNRRK